MLVTGVLWGIVWSIIGTIALTTLVYWAQHARRGLEVNTGSVGSFVLGQLLFFGVYGGISGAIFALLLALAERRRTLEQLSMARVTTWGVLGGAVLPAFGIATIGVNGGFRGAPPMVGWVLVSMLVASALLGGLCASGTLALGRRAPADANIVA